MKPLNLDNRPCSPISSNCVIWQGPDIPCINLCSGDTVSDVVFKLATELCAIMDQLNVTNYDLSCLDLTGCAPSDFKDLIQLLITRICELNGIPSDVIKTAGCPDCVVSVAPCFIEGIQTTMQLVDYVQMIANRVCTIIDQITAINNELVIVNDTLVDLQYQIDNLPVYTLPSIPADCILPAGNYPLDQILNALMNDDILGYCSLLSATGTPAQIISSVLSQCIADGDASLASIAAGDSPVQSFSTYYAGSWVNNPSLTAESTVANAIKNIWIAICDIYTYLQTLALTVQDTNTIDLTYTSGVLSAEIQDSGWWPLNGFEFYNTADSSSIKRPECRRIGNVIHFRGQVTVPLNDPSTGLPLQYTLKTGVNSYLNITTVAPCTGDGGVLTNFAGGISWNYNAGTGSSDSVIPVEVLPAGISLDGNAYNGWKFAFRSVDTGSNSSVLTSLFSISVLPTGVLYASLVKDNEESTALGGSGAYDTCPLNYIISHVSSGDQVPKFLRSSGSLVNGNPTPGVQSVDLSFSATEQYPYSCNANDEDEVGGFMLAIDGIMGYISPCTVSIPSPEPCK